MNCLNLTSIKLATNTFKNWGLQPVDYPTLLGLNPSFEGLSSKEIFNLLKDSRDAKDRIALYLRVYALLKGCFPNDSETRSRWIHQPNRAFKYRSPLQVILEEGFTGLLIINSYLSNQINR